MKGIGTAVLAIATAVIGLAIIAVLVSKRSNTTGVVSSLSNGFASVIGAAVSPIGGGGTQGGYGAWSPSGQTA